MRNLRTTPFEEGDGTKVEPCVRACDYWRLQYQSYPLWWWPSLRPAETITADPDGWNHWADIPDRFTT